MLIDVIHEDETGAHLVRIQHNTPPRLYGSGIFIGPPDLSTLPVSRDDRLKLQRALVDARLVNAETIRGSSGALYHTIKSVLPQAATGTLVRLVKSIYQQDYIEE